MGISYDFGLALRSACSICSSSKKLSKCVSLLTKSLPNPFLMPFIPILYTGCTNFNNDRVILFSMLKLLKAFLSIVVLSSSEKDTSKLSENSDNLDYLRRFVIREEATKSYSSLSCA